MNEHWLMRTLPLLLVGIAVGANQARRNPNLERWNPKYFKKRSHEVIGIGVPEHLAAGSSGVT